MEVGGPASELTTGGTESGEWPDEWSRRVVRNADVDWDRFNPTSYLEVNYRTVRDDDRMIVTIMRDFFASSGLEVRRDAAGSAGGAALEAVDVGTGTNLYPALAMLPFADRIRLFERSSANVAWLEEQQEGYGESWQPFWGELLEREPYRQVTSPREMFRAKAAIEKGDLFDLPVSRYSLGTMFFVAESISTERKEFASAVEAFVGSLLPGAPFAAAFMENSHGYTVDGVWFPAYAVDEGEVGAALAGSASMVSTTRVSPGSSGALRSDHEAMIVATGRAK